MDRNGFTLIEMLLVSLLLSVLSAVAVMSYKSFSSDARSAVTLQKLNVLKAAIIGDARFVSAGKATQVGYETNCLGLPSSLTDLITQPGAGTCSSAYNPYTQQGWRGPYISTTDPNWNKDGWGNTIQYFSAGPPARTLRSCGPDGVCGNADDISVTF